MPHLDKSTAQGGTPPSLSYATFNKIFCTTTNIFSHCLKDLFKNNEIIIQSSKLHLPEADSTFIEKKEVEKLFVEPDSW